MANRNNVVFNVLPANANSAILAKDKTIEDLATGQLGFFSTESGVSIDATSDIPNEFFVALKKPDGDIRVSAGQNIQKKGVLGVQRKNYEAGAPMKTTVSGFKPKFDSEYGIRVEFRNSEIYRIQGHNQYSKAYIVRTPNQVDCGGDECLDPVFLARLLKQEINLDDNDLLVATLVASQAITAADVDGITSNIAKGGTVTDEQVDAIAAHNADNSASITVDLELVPNTISGGSFAAGINLKYYKLLQTVIIVSPLSSLSYSGTKVVSTSPVYAQGIPNNIMQKEYHASSWNGAGPYAISMTTNTAIGNIEYLTDMTKNYSQFALEYNVKNEGGWLTYENPLTTIFALPEGNSTAINSLATMLAKLV